MFEHMPRRTRAVRWLGALLILATVGSSLVSGLPQPAPRANPGPQPQQQLAPRLFKTYAQDIEVLPAAAAVTEPGKPLGATQFFTVTGRFLKNGAPLPGVLVYTFTQDSTPVVSGPDGRFFVPFLEAPGSYPLDFVTPDRCEDATDLTAEVDDADVDLGDIVVTRKVDDFGYQCSQESGNFVDATNRITTLINNGQTADLNLPFAFNYYGINYSTIRVQTRGIAGFGDAEIVGRQGPGNPIPSIEPPNNVLLPLFSNLVFPPSPTNAGVFTSTIQDSSGYRFVIKWDGFYLSPATTEYTTTFEIVLWRKGVGTTGDPFTYDIYFNYRNTGNQNPNLQEDLFSLGRSASVGMEGPLEVNQVTGLQYSYTERTLPNNRSIRFYVPPQGTVTGRLLRLRPPINPLAGTVRALGTNRSYTTRSDLGGSQDGVYTLTLASGPYTLQGQSSRYFSNTISVNIVAGQTITQDISLDSATASYNRPAYDDMWTYANTSSKTYPLQIGNIGSGELRWRLREATNLPPIGDVGGDASRDVPASPLGTPVVIQPTDCITNQFGTVVYEKQVPTDDGAPGLETAGAYSWELNPHNQPLTGSLRVLLYSDHNTNADLFYVNPPNRTKPTIYYNPSARGLCYLANQPGQPSYTINGYFNDPPGFWNALSTSGGSNPGWDIVVVENDSNISFPAQFITGTQVYTAYWPIMDEYLGGSGRFSGREAGKLAISTFDISGADQPPGFAVVTETAVFFNRWFGVRPNGQREPSPRTQFLWDRTSQLFNNPFVLTDAVATQSYYTRFGYQALVDEIVSQPLAGYSRSAQDGAASVVASLDQRGVLANFVLPSLRTGVITPPYDPQAAKWFANMIKYVQAPPINYTDLPWISENPISGTATISQASNVVLNLDTTGISTRQVLTGYLYSASNDPLINLRYGGKIIPLRVDVLLPGDPTPTPRPNPIIDLAVQRIQATGPVTVSSGLPVINVPATLSATIGNIGAISLDGRATVKFLFSQPTTPTINTLCLDPNICVSAAFNGLPGGSSIVVGVTHVFTTAGTTRVWVVVEAFNDGNEGNNIRSGPACVTTRTTPSFTDVPTSNIFYRDIEFLACYGVISGFPNGNGTNRFEPNSNTTRGQFAKIAKLGFGIPTYTPATGQTFSDVPRTNVFFPFIEAAKQAGVISGLNAQQCATVGAAFPCYGPNLNVTRVQVAVIVKRARVYQGITPATPTFRDVPANAFGYIDIETLSAYSIVNGAACASGGGLCFRPNDNIRRGELSKITRRAMESPPR